jgi:hypothetical protein
MSVTERQTLPQTPPGALYTAEDLEHLPTDERVELFRGELCLSSPFPAS